MRSERGFFRRCSLFSLKSQAFDTGNSIHQALSRLHLESTGCDNSSAKGFLIQRELESDSGGKEGRKKWAKTDPGEKTQQSMITSVQQSLVISEKSHIKVKIKVR